MNRPSTIETIVVIGGGTQGLEIAATARTHGAHVIVVEEAQRVLADVCSPRVSALFAAAHRAAGIDVLTATRITETLPDRVTLANGRILRAAKIISTIAQPHFGAPDFTSRQFDLVLQSAGRFVAADASILRRREDGPGLSILHFRGKRLIAIEAVNDPQTYSDAMMLMAGGAHVDLDVAANGEIPLCVVAGKKATAGGRP